MDPHENHLVRESDGGVAQLMARLRELEARLQSEKMEAVGRLAGGVAHDLNNLLTPILAYGNMLTEELAPGTAAREFADEMVKAGDRIAAMTKTLQSLRVKAGNPVPTDAAAAVGAVRGRAAGEFGSEFQIEARLEPAPLVLFENNQLELALEALLRNARLAMPAGGKISVTLGPVADAAAAGLPEGAWVRLAVRDEGAGMASEVREHLYEPYFTTRPKGQGRGLGLATVYAAARRSGGWVRTQSEFGAGTQVEIFLQSAPG